MSEIESKTQTEHLRDVTSQLKEMRHYAQTNTETLSSQWLAFDEGEYKDPSAADKINQLLNQQGALLEALDAAIQDFEIEANRIENEA